MTQKITTPEEVMHAFVHNYHQKLQENFERGLRQIGVNPEDHARVSRLGKAKRVSDDPLEADFFFDGKPFLSVRRANSKDDERRYVFHTKHDEAKAE